jgi:saccharopine dehydrogenase (NAD+, L-lysine-forming)
MKTVLIIGAGGVSRVATTKCAMNTQTFGRIVLASRTKSRCDEIAAEIKERLNVNIETASVDADNVPELVALIQKIQPDLVLNVALPYQDLTIMDACIQTGVDYLDTANYEHPDEAKFEYKLQWAKHDEFKNTPSNICLMKSTPLIF